MRLHSSFPFIHVESIGESVLGKEIPAVRLGKGSKSIHVNAAFHANEWITTTLLMKFIEDYAYAVNCEAALRKTDVGKLFEDTSLWAVPMVNPDGVELVQLGLHAGHPFYEELLHWNNSSQNFANWKANVRGVDLNDQFPAHWEEERERRSVMEPGPRDFTGIAPLTEPEAVAMAYFTCRHDFQLVIALHTQGREIYWNYRDMEPPEAAAIAELFTQVSGYKAVKLTGSDAGYKDWFIQEFRRPGFTIEAGFGMNPLPITQFPQMYEEVAGILLKALEVV